MKKIIILLLFLTSSTVQASDIIGGIDIPHLSTPECMEIKYSSSPIYSAPQSKQIGFLILDNPELAQKYHANCKVRPIIQTQIDKQIKNVETIEISHEHQVPSVYQIVNKKDTWLKIKNGQTFVWIKKEAQWKYISYEQDLVQGIETVKEFCNKTTCRPISLKKQELIKNNGLEFCYGNLYSVNGKIIKIANGRKVYPAKMLEEFVSLYGKELPINTYIPVYSKNKKWNGFYYSKGC